MSPCIDLFYTLFQFRPDSSQVLNNYQGAYSFLLEALDVKSMMDTDIVIVIALKSRDNVFQVNCIDFLIAFAVSSV